MGGHTLAICYLIGYWSGLICKYFSVAATNCSPLNQANEKKESAKPNRNETHPMGLVWRKRGAFLGLLVFSFRLSVWQLAHNSPAGSCQLAIDRQTKGPRGCEKNPLITYHIWLWQDMVADTPIPAACYPLHKLLPLIIEWPDQMSLISHGYSHL